MKKILVATCAILVLGGVASGANITPAIIAGTPNVYCDVIVGPHPILLGGWMTEVEHNNPVEFWLKKIGDKYAFHLFFRDNKKFKETPYSKWRKMIINGHAIFSPGAMFGFSTKNGKVFYRYKGGKSWEMKRIGAK